MEPLPAHARTIAICLLIAVLVALHFFLSLPPFCPPLLGFWLFVLRDSPQSLKLLLSLNSSPPLVQGRLGCSTAGLFVGLGRRGLQTWMYLLRVFFYGMNVFVLVCVICDREFVCLHLCVVCMCLSVCVCVVCLCVFMVCMCGVCICVSVPVHVWCMCGMYACVYEVCICVCVCGVCVCVRLWFSGCCFFFFYLGGGGSADRDQTLHTYSCPSQSLPSLQIWCISHLQMESFK